MLFKIENEIEDESQSNQKLSGDLYSAKMHFRSKFAYPNFDTWWVFARTISKWGNILL